MIKNLDKISKFIMPMLLISTITLMVQINSLPKRISEALNIQPKDTVIVTMPDNLPIKSKMVYFEGTTTDYQKQINNSFEYNPEYPNEFWNGWLTLMKSKNNANYFIWTSDKIENKEEIKGWFMVSNGKWQYNEEYLQALIPVVRRNVVEND